MSRLWSTTVLGGGPVGVIAALAAARRGPTTLIVKHWPPRPRKPRIDVIPAPFLTLLLELGIEPKQLAIEHLHDTQLTAWNDAKPAIRRRRASAHIERSRLERALAAAVHRSSRITITPDLDAWHAPRSNLMIDATGRAAVSADKVQAPLRSWHAHTFCTPWNASKAVEGFRIAPLPTGYAYRVGGCGYLTLGVVLCEAHFSPEQIEDYLRAHGADWLLSGAPRLASMLRGRGGTCSIQWSEGDLSPVRVGDAALARDSLASQGIAAGGSDALQLGSGAIAMTAWAERMTEQGRRHVTALGAIIGSCRFKDQPVWAEYARFLARHSQRAERLASADAEHSAIPNDRVSWSPTIE